MKERERDWDYEEDREWVVSKIKLRGKQDTVEYFLRWISLSLQLKVKTKENSQRKPFVFMIHSATIFEEPFVLPYTAPPFVF